MRNAISAGMILVAACGGSQAPAEAPEATSGNEVVAAPQSTEPEEGLDETEEPAPSGPARLVVRIEVDGRESPGEIVVLDENQSVVGRGQSGAPFSLPAGRYTLQTRIDDPAVLVDKPSRTMNVLLDPGEEASTTVEFGRSRVRLRVEKNGKAVRDARVVLKREASDEVVLDYTPGDDHVAISSGRYDATVHFRDGSLAPVSGLVFMPGATQDVPIRVR